MPALEAGIVAPDFILPTVDGKQVSLAQALKKGPVVLAFFKISCPVCQYAFPYFERLYQPNQDGLDAWKLIFGHVEIPRCDSDPDFPEHGLVNLTVRGGQ